MKTTLKQIQGCSFAALADSGHWMTFDSSPADGGSNGATGPMEAVLNALGACSGIDILLILKKMRVVPSDFQINIEAERADEHPRVFTKVHLEFVVAGDGIKDKVVERAIDLSMNTYCSVAGMVNKTAEITTSYRIL